MVIVQADRKNERSNECRLIMAFAEDNIQQGPINNTIDSVAHFLQTVIEMDGEMHGH